MNSEEPNNMRNPLLFLLCVIIAAAITGGAVWFATKHSSAVPAPQVATPEAVAGTTEPAETEAAAPAAPAAPAIDTSNVASFTDSQKIAMHGIIKDYLLANPDVIMQALQAQAAENQQAQNGRLEKMPADLYNYPLTPFIGPKDAKLVVVEFFDYNCGFCKRVVPDLMKVVGEESDVKFMFKELPILSAESEVAARYALAANKQGRYIEYHSLLMEHQGPVSQELLEQKAKEAGLDLAKLKKDAEGSDIKEALQKNVELARELNVQGTPYFVIGKERVPGAVGYTRLKDIIEQERAALDPNAATDSSAGTTETSGTTDTEAASPNAPMVDTPITE